MRYVLLVVLAAVAVLAGPARAGSPDTFPFEYPDDEGRPLYRYGFDQDGTAGDGIRFRIGTKYGTLRGSAEYSGTAGEGGHVIFDLTHEESARRSTLLLQRRRDGWFAQQAVDGAGTVALRLGADGRAGERLDDATFDCAALRSGPLVQALGAAASRLGRRLESAPDADARHLVPAFQAVLASLALSRGPAVCGADPASSGICNIWMDYDSCAQCCDSDVSDFVVPRVCAEVARRICGSPCTQYAEMICTMGLQISEGYCLSQHCTGKPGDPDCTSPPPCTGLCHHYCGIGNARLCGGCPGSLQCCEGG